MGRRLTGLLALAVGLVGLSGCMFGSVEEMYALPKSSQAYVDLQTKINTEKGAAEFIAPLTGENRQIVKDGLRAIGHTGNPGLRKLVQMAGVDPEHITAYHVGFVIGPCINAGGRLETAKTAMKLFLSEDDAESEALAAHLVELFRDNGYLLWTHIVRVYLIVTGIYYCALI